MSTITFDKASADFILEAFGKTVDKEGYIVEKENTKQRVLAEDGQEIEKLQFAGVRKGSEIFIKSDLISLMQLCDVLASEV